MTNNIKYNDLNALCKSTCEFVTSISNVLEYQENIPDSLYVNNRAELKDNTMKLRKIVRNSYVDEMTKELVYLLDNIKGYFTLILQNQHVDKKDINVDSLTHICKLIELHIDNFDNHNNYNKNSENQYI